MPESSGETKGPAEQPLQVPAILLEDDTSFLRAIPALGKKFVLAPKPSPEEMELQANELPEAYGTGKLVLTPRDPHWLYAHWDLTLVEQRQHNARSMHRHLVVRVHAERVATDPVNEIHVHPESQHWFIHVERAGTAYTADLGYYEAHRKWVTVAQSPVAFTPPETVAAEKAVQFVTIDPDVPFSQAREEDEQKAPAVVAQWHPPQESSLADIFAGVRPGEQAASAEIPLLIGGGLGQEGGWPLALEPGMAGEGQELGGISSLKGGETEARPRFWLNLNAELMIYGGTEPGASITLDGQPIQVRPDGTFSCRFALPDGHYEVIIGAMSEQGDVRQARLKFSRRTERQGEVGVRPSDESLGEMPKE